MKNKQYWFSVAKSVAWVAWFIIATLIGGVITILYKCFTDLDWLYTVNDALESNDIQAYTSAIIEVSIPMLIILDVLVIIPFIIISAVKKNDRIIKKPVKNEALLMITIGVVINIILSVLVVIIPFPESWTEALNSSVDTAVNMPPVFALILTGIMAPICEEIVFRYGIFRQLKNINVVFAMIISALAFGVAHLNPIQSSYAFLIGILAAWIYNKTDNLLDTILIHAGVNFSSTLSVVFNVSEYIFLSIASIILIIIFIIRLKKNGAKELKELFKI